MAGRGRVHAIFAPLCKGDIVHRVSTRATLLRPAQLLTLAARDARVRAALARTLERHGVCETDSDTCGYILLAHPASLCPACPVPEGGGAYLLTASAGPEGEDVELAAWAVVEGLEEPELARVDKHSACWGRGQCVVELAVVDAHAVEVARQSSVMLLVPPPYYGQPLWPLPPGPA